MSQDGFDAEAKAAINDALKAMCGRLNKIVANLVQLDTKLCKRQAVPRQAFERLRSRRLDIKVMAAFVEQMAKPFPDLEKCSKFMQSDDGKQLTLGPALASVLYMQEARHSQSLIIPAHVLWYRHGRSLDCVSAAMGQPCPYQAGCADIPQVVPQCPRIHEQFTKPKQQSQNNATVVCDGVWL